MITPLLRSALEPVVDRHRRIRALALATAGLVLLASAAFGWPHFFGGARVPMLVLVPLAAIVWWLARRIGEHWGPDYSDIARRIERQHPELHAVLLTAVEQQPDPATGRLHFLQQRVLADAAAQARRQNWIESVPRWKLGALRAAAGLALAALLAPAFFSRSRETTRPATAVAKKAAEDVEVSPGNVSLERGSGLLVLATFHRTVPDAAVLLVQPANQPAQRVPLTKNFSDPVFGGGVPEVDGDLTYRVEYAGQTTAEYAVKVFEHPRLEHADATLRFPAYTKLPEKKVPDTRRVAAVEGTKIDVEFALNKPVKSAALVAKDGATIPLALEAGQPRASLRDFTLKTSQTYEVKLEDAEGRASKVPAQLALEALPNRPPELKIALPKGDQRVSPLQEVSFGATAWDDFGLLKSGLTVKVADRGEQVIELAQATAAEEKRELAHLLQLETVGVKPDELVSWYLWAEDIGPDGRPRRTATDMFFAEVRPFEEIFRRGDDAQAARQSQQQSAAGQQAEQMANAQKEIISATWNLKRAEDANSDPKKPAEKYVKDVPVVRDAQADLLAKNQELAANVEDPRSAALLENVKREMNAALTHLQKAEQTAEPLPAALAAEQAAYNALLKLAAHEFQVVRRQQQQGQQSGQQNQRNQQQLEELEMKDEKQRYETRREAEPMQNEQQREQLAVLNRLKELARRQQDVNERLKELQTQLQAAASAKEKEELKRQLKRLREEEQQVLADLDETRQRMEQSPQQAEFSEQRRQLEQARNDAQQAAQAMAEGRATQALASGARAQQNLQEMRDGLRKKTSGQFNEQMREMRTGARELAQTQQEIAEQLRAEPAKPGRRTLDGSGEREKLTQQLGAQRGNLAELSEKMKRLSDQAEAAEPLLARELYDTLRKSAQAGTGETLEKTELLSRNGNAAQAQRFEEKARGEIEELKRGIERAAEQVLGDEAEALRQARAEVEALNEQLTRELARARPDLAANNSDPRQPADTPAAPTGDKGSRAGFQPPGEGILPESPAQDPPSPQRAANAEEGRPGSARVSRAGDGVAPSRTPEEERSDKRAQISDRTPGEVRPGATPGPARETRALPGQSPRGARLTDLAANPRTQQRGGNEGRGGGAESAAGPLTGEDFTQWSDRLRNVEEMIDDPALRTEAARIREAAKAVRGEFKRHSAEPNWELVNARIRSPLAELRDRLSEELARRGSKENLVPIDRDPVPAKYAERVRRYYEELGSSR